MLYGRRQLARVLDVVTVSAPVAGLAAAHLGWVPHVLGQVSIAVLLVVLGAGWLVTRRAAPPVRPHVDDLVGLQPTFEAVGVPLLLFTVDGTCRFANQAARRALGLAPAAPLPTGGWPGYRLLLPDGETPVAPEQLPVTRAAAGEPVDTEVVLAAGEAAPLRVLVQARPLTDAGGAVTAVVLTALDVTALYEQHRRAEWQGTQLAAIAEASRAVLRERDARGAICRAAVTVSGAAMASLYEPDDGGNLVATACDGGDVVGTTVSLEAPAMLTRSFLAARTLTVTDVATDPAVNRALLRTWARSHASPMVSAAWIPVVNAGRCVGVLSAAFSGSVRDWAATVQALEVLAGEAAVAIERQDLLRRLSAEAWTDGLTGAANRRAWDALLDERMNEARRRHSPLSVVLIDLDHFKRYNDEHGHLAGDDLLRAAVLAWHRRIRPGDLLCRWGGEEFALLLPNCTIDSARALAGDLRHLVPGGQTISAGVATWNGEENAESLVARADAALYTAKDAGRDRVVADATQ